MKKNTKTILLRLVVGFAACVFVFDIASAVLFAPQDDQNISTALLSNIAKKKKPVSYDMKLSIPSAHITASVQEVGITKKGNIGTPSNFTDVAWYDKSPLPGNTGTSIIDGHVDNGLAFPAVFWNLKDVKKGDSVYITEKGKGKIHFVVTDIATYDFNAPTDAILAPSKTSTVKLITCAGVYVAALKTHDKRLVVTAEKVAS